VTIFNQGDQPQGIYCVASGHLLLTQSDLSGNETALRLATPGELIGHRSLFAEQAHAATARALTPCRVCFIPGAAVREILESNPAFALRLLRTVARDRGPLEAPLLRGPWLSVRVRLVHLLLVHRDRCSETLPDGRLLFELPLTRRDIASMLGVRPESISRAIQDLQDEGVASFRGRRVVSTLDRLLGVAKVEMVQ
jgi:CRP/FNR family transcriptional regulator